MILPTEKLSSSQLLPADFPKGSLIIGSLGILLTGYALSFVGAVPAI